MKHNNFTTRFLEKFFSFLERKFYFFTAPARLLLFMSTTRRPHFLHSSTTKAFEQPTVDHRGHDKSEEGSHEDLEWLESTRYNRKRRPMGNTRTTTFFALLGKGRSLYPHNRQQSQANRCATRFPTRGGSYSFDHTESRDFRNRCSIGSLASRSHRYPARINACIDLPSRHSG